MNVVDSSGWLEYFANAANAQFFAPAIEAGKDLVIPVITLFEVYTRVAQQRGPDDAMTVVGLMAQQGDIANLTGSLALSAAELSVRLKLPMADSLILATAEEYRATLYTQDADFAAIPGVKYIAKNGAPSP